MRGLAARVEVAPPTPNCASVGRPSEDARLEASPWRSTSGEWVAEEPLVASASVGRPSDESVGRGQIETDTPLRKASEAHGEAAQKPVAKAMPRVCREVRAVQDTTPVAKAARVEVAPPTPNFAEEVTVAEGPLEASASVGRPPEESVVKGQSEGNTPLRKVWEAHGEAAQNLQRLQQEEAALRLMLLATQEFHRAAAAEVERTLAQLCATQQLLHVAVADAERTSTQVAEAEAEQHVAPPGAVPPPAVPPPPRTPPPPLLPQAAWAAEVFRAALTAEARVSYDRWRSQLPRPSPPPPPGAEGTLAPQPLPQATRTITVPAAFVRGLPGDWVAGDCVEISDAEGSDGQVR